MVDGQEADELVHQVISQLRAPQELVQLSPILQQRDDAQADDLRDRIVSRQHEQGH